MSILITDPQRSGRASALRGTTVWLTGLPSAGKTTIATALAELLDDTGYRVTVLDGDEMRRTICSDLGFSRADRRTNVTRIGAMAERLSSEGLIVLVPVIAPYASDRAEVRTRHRDRGIRFLEVHVATPLEVCSIRDVKGLYALRAAGRISALTGVDDPYEVPTTPDLRIDTQWEAVSDSVALVYDLITSDGR